MIERGREWENEYINSQQLPLRKRKILFIAWLWKECFGLIMNRLHRRVCFSAEISFISSFWKIAFYRVLSSDWKSFVTVNGRSLISCKLTRSIIFFIVVLSLHDTVQCKFWHRAQVQSERENISLINPTTNISLFLLFFVVTNVFVLIFFPLDLKASSSPMMTQRSAYSWHSKAARKRARLEFSRKSSQTCD